MLTLSGQNTRIQFGDQTPEQISATRNGNNLVLANASGDTFSVTGWLQDDGQTAVLQNIQFADAPQEIPLGDGASLSWEQLLQRGFDIDGTAGDDNLTGTGVADRLDGKGGNDLIFGLGGNVDNDYCYATRFFRWRNYGCFVITCFNASLMRVCQPRPCALKCSSTSASTRMVKVTFVLAALLPLGRPRTGFSSLNSASFSAYVSASAAIPALIAASSAAVGVMNLRLLNIAIHLSGIGFTQTDNAAHSAVIDKHHAIHPLANRRITDHARLSIVHAGIGLGPQPLPFQLLRQGQRNAMFRQVGSIFGRIKSNVHRIYCMYTYFKVKPYFKGHDFEQMGTVVALAPKPFLTTAVIDVDDPLGGHGGNDLIWAGDGNDRLFGDAGNDTVLGAAAQDLLTGGTGDNDQLRRLGDTKKLGAGDTAREGCERLTIQHGGGWHEQGIYYDRRQ